MEARNNHELLEQKMCKEIEMIENKYLNNSNEMTIQDVEKLDKLYHTLKSMATYNAMKEAEGYEDGGMSGRRGRNPMNGQYASRDGYSEGYDRGYSGHYPMMPYYPGRW